MKSVCDSLVGLDIEVTFDEEAATFEIVQKEEDETKYSRVRAKRIEEQLRLATKAAEDNRKDSLSRLQDENPAPTQQSSEEEERGQLPPTEVNTNAMVKAALKKKKRTLKSTYEPVKKRKCKGLNDFGTKFLESMKKEIKDDDRNGQRSKWWVCYKQLVKVVKERKDLEANGGVPIEQPHRVDAEGFIELSED